MSDQNKNGGDTEARADAESNGDEYEVERLVTREEGAAVLRRLADGVANGTVELGDKTVVAAVPERFELEIEYEQERETAELEAELEWPVVDGEAVAVERESDARERDETDGSETTEDTPVTDDGGENEVAAREGDPEANDEKSIADIIGIGNAASNARFELYRDRADEWRWRLVHNNGNIIADSGEGYDRKATARNGLESVMRNAPGATIVTRDD